MEAGRMGNGRGTKHFTTENTEKMRRGRPGTPEEKAHGPVL